MDNAADINIYGVERNLMDTIYQDQYYSSENSKDPYGTNKNYGPLDVVEMLYDIEEYSKF